MTSIGLAIMARHKADTVNQAGLPAIQVEQTVPATDNDAPFAVQTTTESDAPVLESQPVESSSSDAPEGTK